MALPNQVGGTFILPSVFPGAWEEFASHASHARDKKQDPENLDSPFRGHHNEFVMNHNESVMFETNLL